METQSLCDCYFVVPTVIDLYLWQCLKQKDHESADFESNIKLLINEIIQGATKNRVIPLAVYF